MNFSVGDKVLITTSNWFYAPDGRTYRAVFGTVHGILDDKGTLGIATNKNSSNWYVSIGNLIVAGCQIHYAVKTNCCNLNMVKDWQPDAANGINLYDRPSAIFNADQQ